MLNNASCVAKNLIVELWNLCCKINGILGEKISQMLAVICVAAISIMWILEPYFNFAYCGYTMIVFYMIITCFSVVKVPKFSYKKDVKLYLVISVGIIFLISALILKDKNNVILGASYALMIPLINLSLDNKQNKIRFIKCYSIGGQFAFVFLILASVIFAPFLDEQYSSVMLNPNGLSNALIPMIVGAIWLIEYYKNNNRIKCGIFAVFFALEVIFCILTRSRTGLLAVIIVCIIWGIYIMLCRKKLSELLKQILVMLLICAMMLPFTTIVLSKVNKAIMMKEYDTLGYVCFFTTKEFIKSDDPKELDLILNPQDSSEAIEGMMERAGKGISEEGDISSGRFDIWMAAIRAINIKGHSFNETFFVPERDIHTRDAHNMLLTVGFQSGIFGALFISLFTLAMAKEFVEVEYISIKRKKQNIQNLFFLIMSSSFFTVAMLSSTFTPLGSMLAAGFWCTIPISKEEE